jgi:hypothetical protein
MLQRVEVKGATGGASAVILTRNEVLAARADPEAATLAIVHGIMLDRSGAKATGGVLRIINPWEPDDGAGQSHTGTKCRCDKYIQASPKLP